MDRSRALFGSAVFFFIAPGAIAGLIPWWITRWRFGDDAALGSSLFGGALMIVALAALIECFVRFALRGAGTPAPLAPTQKLVVTGLYRHVRNPMYVAVLGLIFGQALLFAQAGLIAYGVSIWIAFHVFVVGFEEQRLRVEFAEDYAAYVATTPRWIPRLTPPRSE